MNAHSVGHFWFRTPACHLPPVYTYIGLVQHHTCIHCFRDMQQSASDTLAGISA